MAFTMRFKVLSAIAGAILVYVLASAPDATTSTEATSAGTARPGARVNSVTAKTAKSVDDAGVEASIGARAPRNVSSTTGPDASALLARLTHRVTDGKSAPSLFHSQSWYIPPPPPPPAPVVAPPPPPAPTAPPLPFGVMGSYARPGDAPVYFLTRGDRVFDVRVGDTIDHTYSVDSATNGQLLFTYLPLKIQQSLALGGTQ